MANIESVSHETRVFEPPRGVRRAGQRLEGEARPAQRRGGQGLPGILGRPREERAALAQAVHARARRIEGAVLQVVRGRRAQRLVQLPRPQSRERQRREDRDHLRGRRRRGDQGHVSRAACTRLPVRQRAQVARRQKGRSRHHLHADVGRGRRRDAGMRAHRRDAFGGVRRLLGQVAAGAHHRRRRHRRHHRRRAGARRQASAAQGDRRRGAGPGRLRGHTQRRRLSAHRRQGRVLGSARRLDARAGGEAGGHLHAGVGGRRASAVHPLHLGIDRQAEGRAAQLGRLPAVGDPHHEVDLRHQAGGRFLVHRRHRLGDRSHLHHLRPARRRRDRDRVRGHPDVPGRRTFLADDRQAQGAACSTPRRPRSAR